MTLGDSTRHGNIPAPAMVRGHTHCRESPSHLPYLRGQCLLRISRPHAPCEFIATGWLLHWCGYHSHTLLAVYQSAVITLKSIARCAVVLPTGGPLRSMTHVVIFTSRLGKKIALPCVTTCIGLSIQIPICITH